jgi:hypothetical protein
MDYAIWVYNRIPKASLGGLSPDEFWTSTRSNHADLRRAHVFGCPVYVLDPHLQNGQRIPKWNARARQGMFVGFSTEHSSLVPLVLNLSTGNISPQYHVIFDDKFLTVPSLRADQTEIDDIFACLYATDRDFFLDPLEDSEGEVVLPSLSSEWMPSDSPSISPSSPPPSASEGDIFPSTPVGIDLTDFDVDEDPETELQSSLSQSNRYPSRSRKAPSRLVYTALPILGSIVTAWGQPPPLYANVARAPTSYHPTTKVTKSLLGELSLLSSSWSTVASAFLAGFSGPQLTLPIDFGDDAAWPSLDVNITRVNSLLSPDLSPLSPPSHVEIDFIQPHAFSAKARGNPEDNPTLEEAFGGEHQVEYYQAALDELKVLQEDLDCWELVPYVNGMHVLPSTWAFKCKRYPDGRIKKVQGSFLCPW